MKYYVNLGGVEREVQIRATPRGLEVTVDGETHPVDLAEVEGADLFSLLVDGQSHAYAARFENGEAVLSFHDREVTLGIEDERTRLARLATGGRRGGGGPAEIRSVMPGVVKEVRVERGEEVAEGQALLILEAMKMENEIRASRDGVVEEVHVKPGQAVEKGAPLLRLAAPA